MLTCGPSRKAWLPTPPTVSGVVRIEVERWSPDLRNRIIVHDATLEIDKERRFPFRNRSTQTAAKVTYLKRRATRRKRIARVETLVGEIERRAASELVGSGARQDVDTARRLIVLSRKRILVDANLANRIFRRKTPAGETVDEYLSAVWSNRWTSQGLQRCRELVRIERSPSTN